MTSSTFRQRYHVSRFRIRPAVMTFSAIFWACLWSSFSPFILISGALLGWLIGIVFPLPPMYWRGRLRPLKAAYLVAHLFADLVVSSIRMIGYVFERKVDLHASVVRVDLHSDDDLYQTGIASMISLVPGTVVVEVVRHPRRLYLHCVGMDRQSEDDIHEMVIGVERRLLNAIGSAAQIADFEDSLATPTVAPATDWEAEEAEASAKESGENTGDEEAHAISDVSAGFAAGEADAKADTEGGRKR